jgi:CHAT domain-containing protein
LPGDEIRSAFLTHHLRPYQELLRMAVRAGRGDAVLAELERCRARALDERLAEGAAALPGDDARELRDRLNWLYRRVQRLHDEASASATLNEELLRTERELLERARRDRLVAAAPLVAGERNFQLAPLQAALHAGDALVEYGVLDDELFACVVTPGGVTLHRHLVAWSEVLDAVRSARFQIEALRDGMAPVQRHMATLTQRARGRLAVLHALIWAPLADALAGCARVLIVPHAQLGSVPFAALSDGEVCLGQRHELAVAPSAQLALRGLQRRPAPARRALALGDSTHLPHAGREARFVAGLFDAGRAFVGEQATLAALREHAVGADVLHLACHAQFRSDNPRFSALYLHDGTLSAEQAEQLELGPCTVVLSACESGLADHASGDEMVGLVRAFMVAGAARVVASLWPVDDAVTLGFMTHFYTALGRAPSPAAALREAQAAVMREHPHPYHWGAFTLYGGW